jgi:hypothetical protein
MNRNGLYVLVGALLVIVVGFGIYTYREQSKPGVELKLNEDGVSLKKN